MHDVESYKAQSKAQLSFSFTSTEHFLFKTTQILGNLRYYHYHLMNSICMYLLALQTGCTQQ